ncbi:hypothetical protein ACJIZ3_023534 [Penstemon smallii]|uniref:26S proteasome non-ATPase regulatory subunit 4 homolog n=1 Tax=Penstemon smallii TaxID=265156 RepID=A0ABD3TRA6_9LAMI
MAGKRVRVLVTLSDLGKHLACMHGLEIGNEMNFTAGIQVAQLALKHRQNKKQQQRIIVFVGSPVKYEKKVLELIGRKLKKNNVALDFVNFGEEDDEKTEKLEALLAAVNNNDSSLIVDVSPGRSALSDVLMSQLQACGMGFVPLIMSDHDDENALLQQSLAMSMDDSSSDVAIKDTDMSDASADDHDLQLGEKLSLQLSVQEGAADQSNQTYMNKLLADQSFVSSILASNKDGEKAPKEDEKK